MTSPVVLSSEQNTMLNQLWSALSTSKVALGVAPTGSGKTEIMREFIKRASVNTLVLCGRKELAGQLARRLNADGVYSASLGVKNWGAVTVGTVGTISRLSQLPPVTLVVIDEAHNLIDDENSLYQKALSLCPNAKVLGFTATPFGIYGPDRFWPKIDARITLEQLWRTGWIVNPVMQASREQFNLENVTIRAGEYALDELEKLTCDEIKVKKQVADALPRLEGRKKVVWACTSIKHAEMVVSQLSSGVCVHSKQTKELRNESLRSFEHGGIRHLVFVTVVSEGYDYPPIDAVVFMRPTRSARLYVQTVGRGLRKSPDKEDCLVLDYGRVVETLGPINRVRVLEKRPAGAGETNEVSLWLCEECYGYNELLTVECVHCGAEKPIREATKNLTSKAASGSIIGVGDATREKVTKTTVSRYLSKKGTKCIKIVYETKHIFRTQYFYKFVMGWNFKSFASDFDEFPSGMSFDELYQWIVEPITINGPEWLEWVQDGKYTKVVKVGKGD